MRYFLLVVVLSSSYFVEWIPNNATTSPAPSPAVTQATGEFPWQL